jgi:quercetin dioxygenase-like cupin family protein
MSRDCVNWDDVTETASATGVTRRELRGAGVALVMLRIPAGTEAARHSHPHEQFVQVLSGSGVLETADGTFPFGPGSVLHFAPEAWHAARFTSETVLVETNLHG